MEKPTHKIENKKKWDRLLDNLEGKHAEKFDAMLSTADDEMFALNYIKILEYSRPKLQRQEIIEEKEDKVIKIVHVSGDLEGAEGSIKEE